MTEMIISGEKVQATFGPVSDIAPGALVVVRSGSPVMTVISTDLAGAETKVVWFDEVLRCPRVCDVPTAALKLATNAEKPEWTGSR